MNTQIRHSKKLIASAVASLILVACSATPIKPDTVNIARIKLTQLQSNQQLAKQAPVAMKEAEDAVRAAEAPQSDKEKAEHLMYIAERKVDTTQALAESRLMINQRAELSRQRESARLDARTKEVDIARSNAETARMETQTAQMEADTARSRAESERQKTLAAQQESALAQQQSAMAQQETADLQRQIAELNAKPTERGLVVTLGDVLFDTGKAVLKSDANTNLSKLAAFLNKYPDRTVLIEGHTDTVGNEDYNKALSQRRADSVKVWLMKLGVKSDRLVTSGNGELSPVSSNDTASGRQLNRRVEVIIENSSATPN